MTIGGRVISTVSGWCGFSGFDTSNALAVLWAQSSQAASIPFSPQSLLILIPRLQAEFRNPNPDLRDLSSMNVGSFTPGGAINSVDDLISAVMFAPVPAAVHAMIGGFAHEDAKNEMVNAIADEVVRRLQPDKPATGKAAPKKATKNAPKKGDGGK